MESEINSLNKVVGNGENPISVWIQKIEEKHPKQNDQRKF